MDETYTDVVTTDSYKYETEQATESVPVFSQNDFEGKELAIISLHYTLATLGMFANLLVIVVLLSSVSLRRKPINQFIIHQAFIDLLSCSCAIFEEALGNFPSLIHQPVLCHLFFSRIGSGITYYASTYNMVFLSIERYQAIINPFQYNIEKVLRRLPFVFFGTWLLCIGALCIVPVTTVIKDGICMPAYLLLTVPALLEYYTPHCLVVSFIIPVTIMIFCYSRMYLAMRTSLKLSGPRTDRSKSVKRSSGTTSSTVHKSRLAQVNILQTCLILASLTSICWITNVSALIMLIAGYYDNLGNDHVVVGFLLLIVNALLNPYVSIIRYDALKVQLKLILGIKTTNDMTVKVCG